MSTEPDAVWTDKRRRKIARRIEADIVPPRLADRSIAQVRKALCSNALRGIDRCCAKLCISLSTIRWQNASWTERRAVHLRAKCRAPLPAPWSSISNTWASTIGDLLGARPGARTHGGLAAEHIDEPGIQAASGLARRGTVKPGLPPPPERFYVLAEQSKNLSYSFVYRHLGAAPTKHYVRSQVPNPQSEAVGRSSAQRTHSDIVAAVTAGDSAWAKTSR